MTEFDDDLARANLDLADARASLLGVVRALTDDALDRGRRGSWPVRQVLDHVIQSEVAYARVIAHIRGLDAAIDAPTAVASVPDALDALGSTRASLLAVLDGVGEDEFYELRTLGHDQYSVLSVLENVAAHDHEHAGQIERTVGS